MELIGAGLAAIGMSGAGVGIGIVFGILVIGTYRNPSIKETYYLRIILVILGVFILYYKTSIIMSLKGEILCMGTEDDNTGKVVINNITNKYNNPGLLTTTLIATTGATVNKTALHPLVKLGGIAAAALLGVGIEKTLLDSSMKVYKDTSNSGGKYVNNDNIENNGISSIELVLEDIINLQTIEIYLMTTLVMIYIINKIITEENINKYIKNERIRRILNKIYGGKKKLDMFWYVFITITILIGAYAINYFIADIYFDLHTYISQYIRVKGLELKNWNAESVESNLEWKLHLIWYIQRVVIIFMMLMIISYIIDKIITEENINKYIKNERIKKRLKKIFTFQDTPVDSYIILIILIFISTYLVNYLLIEIINSLHIYIEQYLRVKGLI